MGFHISKFYILCGLYTSEPPSLSSLKINFKGSVNNQGQIGGAGFVIWDTRSAFVVADNFSLWDNSSFGWIKGCKERLVYAITIPQADHIILEGDSKTVISWISTDRESSA